LIAGSHAIAHGDVKFELESDPSSKSACWLKSEFAEFSGEIARDYLGKRHEPGLRVGRHGKAALEGSDTVSSADPGVEGEGVLDRQPTKGSTRGR
jgi:hypothetical protein